jgi:peptide/nickel transport system permease protein
MLISYVIKRIVAILPVALGVVTLVALLSHVIPGDPVDVLAGEYATAEQKLELRQHLGLDQPLHIQLLRYYQKLGQGDLGLSINKQRPVTELIGERIQATMELAALAMTVAISTGIPIGITAAVFAGTFVDYAVMGLALLGIAMPSFWLASMLILFFSLHLDLLPVSERSSWDSYILPALSMGLALGAILSRMTRNAVLDCLGEDYVRTARAKGLSEFKVVCKHVLRNAALPLVTIIGLQFGVILTGAVITEVIFDWPGVGSLLLEAVRDRDYPVIQGCVLMFSGSYLLVNLITDLVYGMVDPRIKMV